MPRAGTFVPFVPFVVVSALHLAVLLAHADIPGLTAVTKALLMPALAVGLLWSLARARGSVAAPVVVLALVALAFSLLGDIFVGLPDPGFLVGLGAFFVAHLAYLVLFRRFLRSRRISPLAAVYAVWWVALLLLLLPHLGVLAVPVAIYGLVLGGAATVATAVNRAVSIGALLFLVSDSLLALKLFLPGFVLWEIDFVIMVVYCTAQGLLIAGVVRAASTRGGSTAELSARRSVRARR
jgi:uncharacterized membrane protein YhhN